MQSAKKNSVMDLLKNKGAILSGHFELSSGLHSSHYFQCAKLLQYPEYAKLAGKKIASFFDEEIDTVVAPALGGIIIGYEVANHLNKKYIFVERKAGELCLRRGFEISKGESLIIIEDVITTAESALETKKVIENLGGKVVGVGCIVDRSQNIDDINIKSLIKLKPEIYDPQDCPLCKNGSSPEKPGSRTGS